MTGFSLFLNGRQAGQMKREKYVTPIFLLLFYLCRSLLTTSYRSSTHKTKQLCDWRGTASNPGNTHHRNMFGKECLYCGSTVKLLYERLSSDNEPSKHWFARSQLFSHLLKFAQMVLKGFQQPSASKTWPFAETKVKHSNLLNPRLLPNHSKKYLEQPTYDLYTTLTY